MSCETLARRMLWARLAMSGPHDLFARYTFGHPERAAAELRAVLPAHVVSEVDWPSLRREPGSVVDPELRETESDLLFTARLRSGQPLLLYLLLEHQSSVDRWMALRMLRYVVRQLERWRQEHPESARLPLIVPLEWTEGKAVHAAARQVLHSLVDEQRAEGLMGSWAEEMIEQGVQKGLAKGLTQGRAEDILRILTARGVHVDEAARQRILGCTDLDTLDRWFDRALNATTLSDVLDDLAQ